MSGCAARGGVLTRRSSDKRTAGFGQDLYRFPPRSKMQWINLFSPSSLFAESQQEEWEEAQEEAWEVVEGEVVAIPLEEEEEEEEVVA